AEARDRPPARSGARRGRDDRRRHQRHARARRRPARHRDGWRGLASGHGDRGRRADAGRPRSAAAGGADQPQDAAPDPREHRAQPGPQARLPRARGPRPRNTVDGRARRRRRNRARHAERHAHAPRRLTPKKIGVRHQFPGNWCLTPIFRKRVSDTIFRRGVDSRARASFRGWTMRASTFLGKIGPVMAVFAVLGGPAVAQTTGGEPVAEPFKLGTFEIDGRPTVGIVLRDRLVVELDAANAALELDPAYVEIPMPDDMLGLIGRYEYGLKRRLYEIVNHVVGAGTLDGPNRPGFVHEAETLRTLPPIMYPGKIL